MRKKLIYNIIGLAVLIAGVVGCDQASQEASPIVEPDDSYPVATFTTDFTGSTITEGDTIMYTITLNKPINHDLRFEATIHDGTADDHDIVAESVTITAYDTEAVMYIIFSADDYPEVSETIQIEVGIVDEAMKYLVHPSTTNPVLDLTINNYNDPGSLTVALEWATEDDDIDLFIISEDYGAWAAAASSDNPEITTGLWAADPDGNYFITLDPYHVEGSSFDYILSLGYPDGEVEFIEGTFDMTALDSYIQDYFDAWDMYTYRIATAVNSGGDFTVTAAK